MHNTGERWSQPAKLSTRSYDEFGQTLIAYKSALTRPTVFPNAGELLACPCSRFSPKPTAWCTKKSSILLILWARDAISPPFRCPNPGKSGGHAFTHTPRHSIDVLYIPATVIAEMGTAVTSSFRAFISNRALLRPERRG